MNRVLLSIVLAMLVTAQFTANSFAGTETYAQRTAIETAFPPLECPQCRLEDVVNMLQQALGTEVTIVVTVTNPAIVGDDATRRLNSAKLSNRNVYDALKWSSDLLGVAVSFEDRTITLADMPDANAIVSTNLWMDPCIFLQAVNGMVARNQEWTEKDFVEFTPSATNSAIVLLTKSLEDAYRPFDRGCGISYDFHKERFYMTNTYGAMTVLLRGVFPPPQRVKDINDYTNCLKRFSGGGVSK